MAFFSLSKNLLVFSFWPLVCSLPVVMCLSQIMRHEVSCTDVQELWNGFYPNTIRLKNSVGKSVTYSSELLHAVAHLYHGRLDMWQLKLSMKKPRLPAIFCLGGSSSWRVLARASQKEMATEWKCSVRVLRGSVLLLIGTKDLFGAVIFLWSELKSGTLPRGFVCWCDRL